MNTRPQPLPTDGAPADAPRAFATVQQHCVDGIIRHIADYLASGVVPSHYFIVATQPRPVRAS